MNDHFCCGGYWGRVQVGQQHGKESSKRAACPSYVWELAVPGMLGRRTLQPSHPTQPVQQHRCSPTSTTPLEEAFSFFSSLDKKNKGKTAVSMGWTDSAPSRGVIYVPVLWPGTVHQQAKGACSPFGQVTSQKETDLRSHNHSTTATCSKVKERGDFL